jgi:beta-lactamase superfamily II metal-dependent hydrolase
MLQGEMRLRVWDVEHGACAMLQHVLGDYGGPLAMIDSGCSDDWSPSEYITQTLRRRRLDYLFITNADQDHMSDLQGLADEGVYVDTLFRNPTYSGQQMKIIKALGGRVSRDAEWYVDACDRYDTPTTLPFDDHMGGITATMFYNCYPAFKKTNDLSLVIFIEYSGFKILFPGDLEGPGWRALLQRPDFQAALPGTNILVASHHGRRLGFCEEVFDYFTPDAVVISDKHIEHDSQLFDYGPYVRPEGIVVQTTMAKRRVLTTRNDGWIQFTVGSETYVVDTECGG